LELMTMTTDGDNIMTTILKETGGRPEAQRAALRCKQVLDAAQECFSRDGFHGASMAEISKAAGMSAGHIYNYFDSKEAIIAAIVQRGLDELVVRFDQVLSEPDVAAALVRGLADSVQRLTEPDAAALRFEILAEAARNPKVAAMVQAADAVRRERLSEIVRIARVSAGVTSDTDIETRAELLGAIFNGLGQRALANPGLDKEALTAMLGSVVTHLVRPDTPSDPASQSTESS
jgi:TetR/AcrR family transcriptional repressor of uid operon